MMNVLNPALMWVDGRCYRILESTGWSDGSNISPYVEDNCPSDYKDSEDEYSDTDIEIEPYGSARFKHSFHVAKSFFPFIIGSKHAVRKRLETETKTTIQIPKLGQDGDIVIIGFHRKGILKARRRINLLIEASRKKLECTHFLSIPLNEGHIIMKFNMFKNEVLTNSGKMSRGVDERIFQTPSKLHITIGVLTLVDDTERNQAIEALNYCKDYIVKPIIEKHGQIPIHIQGTEIMNDDPCESNVLYAKILDKDGTLQKISNEIVDYYASVGLLQKKRNNVKLHLTLMNTKFQLDEEERNYKNRTTFDATEIIKAHENTVFGETTLKQIHLSQRHTISSNGYYQATAKINLLEVYAVTDSDILEISDGISTIFCSEHTLQMNRTFNAFQMTQKPEITSYRKHIRLKKSMILPDDTLEYWGFYLLEGASVALSVCSRFQGASILVVKGERNLRTCGMLEHHNTQAVESIFLPDAKTQVKVTFKSDTKEVNGNNNITRNDQNDTLSGIEDKVSWNIALNDTDDQHTDIYSHARGNLMSVKENREEEPKRMIWDENIKQYRRPVETKRVHSIRRLRHAKRRHHKEQMKDKKRDIVSQENKRVQRNVGIESYTKQFTDNEYNIILKRLQEKLSSDENMKVKAQEEISNRRVKRNQEVVKPTFLLDQGVKHGGNAGKNGTDVNADSSTSSFENGLFNCYGGSILIAQEFPPSKECTDVNYLLNGKHMQAVHNVVENGYYYYIFYSDNDIVSNDIYALFDIYKPIFRYENVTRSCINQTECSFSINLLSSDRVIVEIPTKGDLEYERDNVDLLLSICHPRMEVYVIFPVAVLFFILACAFM
ncbi:uncharacterized protein LOC143426806 [Xylocopa sonorina]|uniref:uncharacterized protein LOC143426806 n=1 Tax=Xylocopa sonorina TaxID=1818115 RepID=UPI00403B243F